AGNPHGRELSGYVPWQFNLPDAGKGYEAAWKGVTDPEVFLAPYGLYFTEKNDPMFLITQGGCVWSGNGWPYANAQVLTGMANVLNNYTQNAITKADYFKVLQSYTRMHMKNGSPYVAECNDPITGRWTADSPQHSEHYFHSSYNDLVITGVAGLRPRADDVVEVNPLAPDQWDYFALDDVEYHGHRVSIVWDREGKRYNRGQGLSVFADGQRIANRPNLGKLEAPLPTTKTAPTSYTRLVNFASTSEGGLYPRITASATGPNTSEGNLLDGFRYYYFPTPTNRWTSEGHEGEPAWIEVDLGIERPLQNVMLYVLDDAGKSSVRAPASLRLEVGDDDNWKSLTNARVEPPHPVGHRPNSYSFPVQAVKKLRISMTPQPGASVGLTEIELWGEAQLPLSNPGTPRGNMAPAATANASYTWMGDVPAKMTDGIIQMRGGDNRWTAYRTPNASDWIQLDWPQPVKLGRVVVCLWSDGGGVCPPKTMIVQIWDGAKWADVEPLSAQPATPTPFTPNEVVFAPRQTTRLRVVFENDKDQDAKAGTGVTELMAFEK
ncbi:MAG: discoidin domain-containing protein, partial [Armatimonadota bacterium]|nr:discoidin domain-containing protein [Armatimonadota bacterium]